MLSNRQRIMIVGSGGAGKSTFAVKLAAITGLPLIHLDRHHWKPGWEPTPPEEWAEAVKTLAGAARWIIDGNYGGTLEIRARRCDAIVFFDFNRFASLWGAIRRWILRRSRPDMMEENPERLDLSFLRWIWSYPQISRPKVLEAIRLAGDKAEVVRVRNRREARKLLDAVQTVPV